MSSYIYADNVRKSPCKMKKDLDPHEYYLKHFRCRMILQAIMRNAMKACDPVAKMRANIEFDHNERKLAFWERKDGFDIMLILRDIESIKRIDYSAVSIEL